MPLNSENLFSCTLSPIRPRPSHKNPSPAKNLTPIDKANVAGLISSLSPAQAGNIREFLDRFLKEKFINKIILKLALERSGLSPRWMKELTHIGESTQLTLTERLRYLNEQINQKLKTDKGFDLNELTGPAQPVLFQARRSQNGPKNRALAPALKAAHVAGVFDKNVR